MDATDADLAQLYEKIISLRESGDLATAAMLESYTKHPSAGGKQEDMKKNDEVESKVDWMKTLNSPLVLGGVGVAVLFLILRR
jgi:hypothetical protein